MQWMQDCSLWWFDLWFKESCNNGELFELNTRKFDRLIIELIWVKQYLPYFASDVFLIIVLLMHLVRSERNKIYYYLAALLLKYKTKKKRISIKENFFRFIFISKVWNFHFFWDWFHNWASSFRMIMSKKFVFRLNKQCNVCNI